MGEPVGWAGFAGIGLETTPRTPVKSVYKLDTLSESLLGTGEPIELATIRESRMIEKVVMGPYEAAGDLNFLVTPDIATTLIYAALTSLASTGTQDPYVHTFKTGNTLKFLTAQILRDDFFHVYPGLAVSRLVFRPNQEEVLQATASFGGSAPERVYDTAQSESGVVYSSLDPFVFHEATVGIHDDVANTDTMNWEIGIDTGLLRNRGHGSGSRAHNRAHPGRSKVTGSFDLVFDSIEAHRRWMGASASTYPITLGNTPQFFAANILYTQSATRKIKFILPKMYYKASGPKLDGPDGIVIQRCSFGTKKDTTSGTDIQIEVTNAEAGAAITTAGTNI